MNNVGNNHPVAATSLTSQQNVSSTQSAAKPQFKMIDIKTATFKAMLKHNFAWIPAVLKMPFESVQKAKMNEADSKLTQMAKVVTYSILAGVASGGLALMLLPLSPLFALTGVINSAVSLTGRDLHNQPIVVNVHTNGEVTTISITKAFSEKIGKEQGVLLEDVYKDVKKETQTLDQIILSNRYKAQIDVRP